MRLYASEICTCRGASLPTTGTVHLGLRTCRTCLRFRPDETTEVIPAPSRTWRDAVHEDEDGRSTPSVERGARQSRFHGRVNIGMREMASGAGGVNS